MKRKYALEGNWEGYSFRVGNLLFLMMSDRNDLPPPVGRGTVDAKPDAQAFETYLAASPNAIDIWLGAHKQLLLSGLA